MARRLRLLVAIPVIFAVLGGLVIYAALAMRGLWSPLPRVAVGGLVVLTAVVAMIQLWHASPRAPLAVAVAGLTTLAAVFAFRRLFPIYQSASEPASLSARVWYPLTIAAIVVLTIAGAWFAGHLTSIAAGRQRHG